MSKGIFMGGLGAGPQEQGHPQNLFFCLPCAFANSRRGRLCFGALVLLVLGHLFTYREMVAIYATHNRAF